MHQATKIGTFIFLCVSLLGILGIFIGNPKTYTIIFYIFFSYSFYLYIAFSTTKLPTNA
jgi:hypothetical protein